MTTPRKLEVKQELITALLRSTEREGIEDLIKFMNDGGFFLAPASSRFHGACEGGLAVHSLEVYYTFMKLANILDMNPPKASVKLACLLHDLCKVGCYYPDVNGYKTVKPFPQGHGIRSFELAKQFISLTYLESNMIIYHMGPYGTKEYDERKGEYNLAGALAPIWNRFPACKLIYFADELVTLKEKGENGQ